MISTHVKCFEALRKNFSFQLRKTSSEKYIIYSLTGASVYPQGSRHKDCLLIESSEAFFNTKQYKTKIHGLSLFSNVKISTIVKHISALYHRIDTQPKFQHVLTIIFFPAYVSRLLKSKNYKVNYNFVKICFPNALLCI